MAHLVHTANVSLPPSPTSVRNFHIVHKPPTRDEMPVEGERLLLPATSRSSKTPAVRPARNKQPKIVLPDVGPATQDFADDALAEELSMFVVEEEDVELEGYQLYAVEKWVVEREKLLPTVTVWTGDPADKIYVTVLRLADLSIPFTTAVHALRKHGARPKETPRGTIMVTSLANFRSDLNIVHLPGGSYPAVKEDLCVNIDLSRLGCSGRRALTLETPSQATQDKFLQIYHLVPSTPFSLSVLTLIRLVQAALFIFGCFPASSSLRDGLLCDTTVEGLQKWMTEFGEPVFDLEPGGRILEAEVVAALFSSVTGARHRLAQMAGRLRGPSDLTGRPSISSSDVPRDPLAQPVAFLHALSTWQRSQKLPISFLNIQVLTQLKTDNPLRPRRLSDPHKAISRAFRQKLDEFPLPVPLHHTITHDIETTDLEKFSKMSSMKGGDGLDTVRWLWTGRARPELVRRGHSGDAKLGSKVDEAFEDEDAAVSVTAARSTKSSKRSHALMEGITGWKRDLLDFGRHKKSPNDMQDHDSFRSPLSTHTTHDVPTLVISADLTDDDVPTPYRSAKTQPTPSPGRSAQSSWTNLSDTLQRTPPASAPAVASRFFGPQGRKRKSSTIPRPSLFPSRSDTVIHNSDNDDGDSEGASPPLKRPDLKRFASDYQSVRQEDKRQLRRRHSFTDLGEFQSLRRVIVGRLKTDMDLCKALLDLRSREHSLRETVTTLESLVVAQRGAIQSVHSNLVDRRSRLDSLQERARMVIVDPFPRRHPDDGIEPTLAKVQRSGDDLGRLKYTYEVTDGRLKEVEGLVWSLMRRINHSGIPDQRLQDDCMNGVGPEGSKEWRKGGQRLRSRLVSWGMWTYSWWDWARGRGTDQVSELGTITPLVKPADGDDKPPVFILNAPS